MKRTGKIAAAFITALTAVASITACSADYSHIDGYSDIENARKLYSSLYSAEITVTDKQTGTVTQELTFCYDKSDTLSYSYFGTDGKTKYYEYHNGSEYNYYSDGEWHTLVSGDKDYVCYTRTNKMSMTAEGMIFIKPESVTSSEVKNTADTKVITMQYDVSSSTAQWLLSSVLSVTLTASALCIQLIKTDTAPQWSRPAQPQRTAYKARWIIL